MPIDLTPWPPDAENEDEAWDQAALFEGQPIRVVGRLHGSCMGWLTDFRPVRIFDFADRQDCVEIIGHL